MWHYDSHIVYGSFHLTCLFFECCISSHGYLTVLCSWREKKGIRVLNQWKTFWNSKVKVKLQNAVCFTNLEEGRGHCGREQRQSQTSSHKSLRSELCGPWVWLRWWLSQRVRGEERESGGRNERDFKGGGECVRDE